MAGRTLALLVGIDEYVGDVPPLRGCGNDVVAMAALLGVLAGGDLELRVLRDAEATRAGVVAAFTEHLGAAGPDDVALFYYSGHGSNEPAPEELWAIEPDRTNETLVCHDSRTADGRDLADKELAALVAEVAAGGAHVLVVLDCCHSGSGVRGDLTAPDLAIRQVRADTRPRAMTDFLVPVAVPPAGAAAVATARSATSAGRAPASGTTRALLAAPAPPRYVLLAGCEAGQTSKERTIDGSRRGVFTHSLETALRAASGHISYDDLLSWAATRVRGRVADQTPQLEVTDDADRSLAFLGGQVAPGRHHLLLHTEDGWQVDAGAVHGVPEPREDQPVTYAAYPRDADGVPRLDARVADAHVTAVEATRSLVTLTPAGPQAPEETSAYLAVPVAWPVPALRVAVTGRAKAAAATLAAAVSDRTELALVGRVEDADVVVSASTKGYLLRDPAEGTLLTTGVRGTSADSAAAVADRLERVARWRRVRDLANPQTALAVPDVAVEVLGEDGEPVPPGPVLLDQPTDGSSAPGIRVSVHHRGAARLFVAVLGLTSQFGVVNLLAPSPGEWVEPGGSLPVLAGATIRLEVPDVLHAAGIAEVTDYLVVLLSTAPFDAGSLTQPELGAPDARAPGRPTPARSTLEAHLRRVGTRGFVLATPQEAAVADWMTWTRAIVTRRPLPGLVEVPAEGTADGAG